MQSGERSFSPEQVERLAVLVRNKLYDLDPAIKAPLASDYKAERHWAPGNWQDFAVDVDIGPLVISLRKEASSLHPPEPFVSVERAAEAILTHVRLARDNPKLIRSALAMQKKIDQAIESQQLLLRSCSVHPPGAALLRPPAYDLRQFWVRVEVLSDRLRPTTYTVVGRSFPEIWQKLCSLAERQRRCLERLAWLSAADAVIGIDRLAEHAIHMSGLDIRAVVHDLLQLKAGGGEESIPSYMLWGDMASDFMCVELIEGVIELYGHDRQAGFIHRRELSVEAAFPAIITASLPGANLGQLIDYEFFSPTAVIAAAEETVPGKMKIKLRADPRPIIGQELS